MSGFEPEILERIRLHLTDVDDLWRRRAMTLQTPISEGSLAALDDALPDARFVTIFAGQSLAGALDNILAWRLLVHGPTIPIKAHTTLLRAALEGADRARWHLDAALDSGTRVGRGWAGRRDDQRERRAFQASREGPPIAPPPGQSGWKSAVQRLADIDNPKAARLRETAGIRTVPYLQLTDLMILYGHERWYRLLSGLAHHKEWAMIAQRLDRSADPPLRVGVGHGTFSASEGVALAATVATMEAVRAAVSDLERYYRVDPTGL